MPSRRVTQRDVARAAGLSRPAVSLALRNHPGISAATRERVLRLAQEMGYVPDPVLSVLASYRWPSTRARATVSIALLELRTPAEADLSGYPGAVRQGALERARALGFEVSIFNLAEYEGNLRRLLRVIRHRGIGGIIVLPVETAVTLDAAAGWEEFSVVAATTSILAPRFHRVVPNQLQAMSALLEKLHAMGYRRIGAVFAAAYDARTNHIYSMALSWYGHHQRILVLPGTTTAAASERRVTAWMRAHRLEIAFTPEPDLIAGMSGVKKILGQGRGPRLAALGTYLEQYPALIGATAVRVLSGLIYNNEIGIPLHPEVTTIDGAVRENLIPVIGK
jgi:DNA-binding LacI/PurR family transcriptional regulator